MELIRPSGFPTRKAPALKAFVAMLDAECMVRWTRLRRSRQKRCAATAGIAGGGPGDRGRDSALRAGPRCSVADEYLRRVVGTASTCRPAARPRSSRIRSSGRADARGIRSRGARRDAHSSSMSFTRSTVAVGKAHCGKTARCAGCPLAGGPQYVRMKPVSSQRRKPDFAWPAYCASCSRTSADLCADLRGRGQLRAVPSAAQRLHQLNTWTSSPPPAEYSA